ncbi:hypothetical protein [Acetonema longum]|uniref:Uncharacterized protein n=1 Tax=Acetonema longum DSM 6540 TaxID=1009370 RepID=F7NK56_9FIRM|nr:hypothetical protein [Acetonema longum]EGO63497.1 hypothetical protein ALO_12346 [Acetonema longum DSM 6540]
MELVSSIAISPSGTAVTVGGGYLYVFVYHPTAIRRYNLDTLALVDNTQISSVSSNDIRGAVYSDGLVYGAYYSGAYVLKVDYAAGLITPVARANGNMLHAVTTDANYVYFIMANGYRDKYTKGGLSLATRYYSSDARTRTCSGAVISGRYLYTANSMTPGAFTKINLDTLETVANLSFPTVINNRCNDVSIIGDHLYSPMYMAPGKIAKVDLSNFTQEGVTVTTLPLGAGNNENTNPERCLAVGGYLYVQCRTSPNSIIKVDPNTMQIVDTIWHADLGSFVQCRGLAYADGYLYSLTNTRLAKIYVGGDEPAVQSYSFVIGGDL